MASASGINGGISNDWILNSGMDLTKEISDLVTPSSRLSTSTPQSPSSDQDTSISKLAANTFSNARTQVDTLA